MKENGSTGLKNLEGNALDNAVKYLTVAGYKNIVIIASTDDDDADVIHCGGAESGKIIFTHAINFMDECVERFVVKGSYTYKHWKALMLRISTFMVEAMGDVPSRQK